MKKFELCGKTIAVIMSAAIVSLIGVSVYAQCTSRHNAATFAKAATSVDSVEVCHTVVNDTDRMQLNICERVLDECVNAEVLDYRGVKRYHEIMSNPSVMQYIELIAECECEDKFHDTVGEGDAWCIYIHYVLEPRGLAD